AGAPGLGAARAGSGVSSPPLHSPPPVDDQAGGGSRRAGESISSPPPPSAPPVDVQTGSQIFEAGRSSSAAARAGEQAGLPKAKTLLRKIFSSGKNKVLCREGIGSSERPHVGSSERPHVGGSERPHVNQQAIPYVQALNHYVGQILALYRDRIYAVNAITLGDRYLEFRPVEEDGECFYRSFIFSYLEQVLDRKGRNEERRLLAAIQELAEESARLGWASEFSRSHDAFKELMKKVKRWKKKRRLIPISTDRYKRKLLGFFSTYDQTEDIFVFLRLVAASWLCLHRADYTEDIPGLGEDDSVADWCLQHVTPRRAVAGRAQMWALAAALQVSLVLVQLNEEAPDDVYVSPGADAACVHVLFTINHYDILYPI
uniref:OTU domain-containing protein n=1 Tax=Triticum urartu TaxID=4572 RepID=A0A8R7R7C0_TRIUA